MTKADIVHAVYSNLGGFSKKEASDLVDLVFETMKETLGRGEKIKISGFGNFVLRDKRQRQGRNPQTGEPITITARRVLNFKASQLLKQSLNGELESVSGQPSSEADAGVRPIHPTSAPLAHPGFVADQATEAAETREQSGPDGNVSR
jgi:integration host factor subunit alpha